MVEGNLSSFFNLTKSIANVYRNRNEKSPVLSEIDMQIHELSSNLERLQKECSDDFPKDLLALVADIQRDLEYHKSSFQKWVQKLNKPSARILMYVPVIKPFVSSLAPAFALSVATKAGGATTMLLLGIIALISITLLQNNFPDFLEDLHNVWYEEDTKKFQHTRDKLEKHLERLRRFQALQSHLAGRNRFDVSKVLAGEARQFWINNFGAENHSVETNRFIETLLYTTWSDQKRLKNEDRKLIFATLYDIVDQNGDGAVSPHEFSTFLQFFGPLSSCCTKAVFSLIDLSSKPPSRFSWFSWRSVDRDDAEVNLSESPVGTFVVRCSSQPGVFAIDYTVLVDGKIRVRHSIIKNDIEHGYHFDGTQHFFPNLYALVAANSNTLANPFLDVLQPVLLNVGGVQFQSTIGTFLRYPETRLGRMFANPRSSGKETIFLDRDPKVFRVVLNWYRYGVLAAPADVPQELIADELAFFGINYRVVVNNGSPQQTGTT